MRCQAEMAKFIKANFFDAKNNSFFYRLPFCSNNTRQRHRYQQRGQQIRHLDGSGPHQIDTHTKNQNIAHQRDIVQHSVRHEAVKYSTTLFHFRKDVRTQKPPKSLLRFSGGRFYAPVFLTPMHKRYSISMRLGFTGRAFCCCGAGSTMCRMPSSNFAWMSSFFTASPT